MHKNTVENTGSRVLVIKICTTVMYA